MNIANDIIVIIKYIMAIGIILIIVMMPAWLARQNKRNNTDTAIVRIGSWLLGWTGIGWLISLFWGSKK